MKKLLITLCIILFLQPIIFAQQADTTITQTENSDSTKLTFWKKHDVKFAGIPMINYDPSFEWNFAALANAFFKVSPNDTISPLSMAGGMIGTTTNGSWYWALYTRLYLDNDNYRMTIGYGDASANFQYYEEAIGSFLQFTSVYDALFMEAQRRVYKRWYLGLKYVNLKTNTLIEGSEEPVISNMNNLGVAISHDSRDFIYNPHSGDFLNFKTGHYGDFLNSDYKFNNFEFDYTKFFGLNTTKVIAARFSAFVATGDVPFEGQHVVTRDDIRGYTNGMHRADQVYALQAEYRWNFYKKWGMVAFGGVATAVDKVNEINFKDLLPAAGVGLRFMAIPSEKINIGIDVAKGIDDWGLYFRIGETFGDK